VRALADRAGAATRAAPTGQVDTQAPQPVRSVSDIPAIAMPPNCTANRIAPSGQASPQLRQ